MKRIMQTMLAVALVLVTAFTFYLDTASAQSVSAPVAACSPSVPCNPAQVCTIPPGSNCRFTKTGDVVNLNLQNLGDAGVQVIVVIGGRADSLSLNPRGSFSRTFTTGGADITVFNTSNTCTIRASFVNLFKASEE